MLPVTHGIPFTCDRILMYTILLALATVLPFLSGMCGFIYLAAAGMLDALFVLRALKRYLMLLFSALLIDHYWRLR